MKKEWTYMDYVREREERKGRIYEAAIACLCLATAALVVWNTLVRPFWSEPQFPTELSQAQDEYKDLQDLERRMNAR